MEIEILVRLVGYGCPPQKAAAYLDRPVKLVRSELQRLGLGPAQPSKANGDTRRAKEVRVGNPAEETLADAPLNSESKPVKHLKSGLTSV